MGENPMNKNLILTAAVTALASSLAADDAQVRNLENRVCALEQCRNSCGMINPDGRPEVNCGMDLFVTADFLWWQAAENGLAFTVLEDVIDPDVASGEFDLTIEDPKFRWHAGFRVGVGYNLPHDGWDLYLNWTRIHSRASKTVTADAGESFLPGFFQNFAQAKWKLRLNVLDLELGRDFYTSKWLIIRPFIGIRSAWVSQTYATEITGDLAGSTDFSTDMKNRYWGIGPRAGLNSQWGLGCGWSIYGDLAISLVYGHFHIRQDYFEEISGGSTEDFVKHSFRSGRAITDLGLGLRWDNWFCCDSYHLGLQVGYEHHMFFGQNQLNNWISGLPTFGQGAGFFVSNLGDLTMQGFTASARFDF
jgi:hypothetical protein